ncbi:hypothetical protein F5051DRAFT_420245 [Lentinula edodes]|nr:hypothetical protein F5051DRAFT_420245 [Lentinula edodes]
MLFSKYACLTQHSSHLFFLRGCACISFIPPLLSPLSSFLVSLLTSLPLFLIASSWIVLMHCFVFLSPHIVLPYIL